MILDTIGISYRHQKESTHEVTTMLEKFILKQIEAEGYHEGLEIYLFNLHMQEILLLI